MSNYHEYGVNVKIYELPSVEGQEILSDDTMDIIYRSCVEGFWMELSDLTKQEFGKECYSEGRMGGWAVFDTGEYEPPAEWVKLVNEILIHYSEEFYPEMVSEQIRSERYETNLVFVNDNAERWQLVNDCDFHFVMISTDKLSSLSKEEQIEKAISKRDYYPYVVSSDKIISIADIIY